MTNFGESICIKQNFLASIKMVVFIATYFLVHTLTYPYSTYDSGKLVQIIIRINNYINDRLYMLTKLTLNILTSYAHANI